MRQLSEAEQIARNKYNGLTRRQYNAEHGKFSKANKAPKARVGSFFVVALFDGNPVPQQAPFPNDLAALARFEKLMTNPNVMELKLIESPPKSKTSTLYSFQRSGAQRFANSTVETLYAAKGDNTLLSMKAIKQSDKLLDKFYNGEITAVKEYWSGGSAWWERRH